MSDPLQLVLGALEHAGFEPRPSGAGAHESRCPAHRGNRRNLSITTGDDGRVLLHCHHAAEGAACDVEAIVGALGLEISDLFPSGPTTRPAPPKTKGKAYPDFMDAVRAIEWGMRQPSKGGETDPSWSYRAHWTYVAAAGVEAFRVVRFEAGDGAKSYRPIRPTPEGWRIGDPSSLLPLYHLTEVRGTDQIIITEGESCADIARSLGLTGTTSAHGAKSAAKTDWRPLAGKDVAIMPDHDAPGEAYAASVVAILATLTPRPTVRVVRLPGLEEGGDLADWMAGRDPEEARAELEEMIAGAVDLEPAGADPADADDPAEWPPMRLGKLPDVPAFPVEVFPEVVRGFIHAVAGAIGCPEDFAALPVLVVAGAAIGRSASLKMKPGYFASAALYAMNIGGASSGKSPALEANGQPMWQVDEELHDAFRAEREEYEAEVERIEKMPKTGRPSRPAKPALRSAVLDDVTAEAIAPHLAANPRGLLISKDEGSAWVGAFNQYKKGGKGADRQFYLSALFGKPIRVDRKGHVDGEPIRIPHPFLSVIGNMTPDMLGELADPHGRSDGFTERLLFAFPDPRPKPYWTETGIPDDRREDWAAIIKTLRARPMAETEGKPHPQVVHFAPEAKAAWVEWYDAQVDRFNGGTFGPSDAAAEGKLCDFAGRMALILHMLNVAADAGTSADDPIPPLDLRAVAGAISLWAYFRAHHRRVRAALAGRTGDAPEGARLILRWIAVHHAATFKESDLTRDVPQLRLDRAILVDGLAWLQGRGVLRPTPQPDRPAGTRGRKPAPTWEVHPALGNSEYSDISENSGEREAEEDESDNSANTPNCPNFRESPAGNQEEGEWVA